VLMARAGIPLGWEGARKADALLRALEAQELIHVDWAPPRSGRRNRYELLFTRHHNGREVEEAPAA
jgi:hypothetical protein